MRSRIDVVVSLAVALALVACSDEVPAPSAPTTLEPRAAAAERGVEGGRVTAAGVMCAPGNGGITLPSGFCASVVADQVGKARHLIVTEKRDAYVAIGDSTHGGGVL